MINNPVPLLHDYLINSAHQNGAKVALVCDGHRVTYDQLEAWSNAVAHHLVEAGVERGDRVMIFADNTVEAAVRFTPAPAAFRLASSTVGASGPP